MLGGAVWLAGVWSGCGGRSALDSAEAEDTQGPSVGNAGGGVTPRGGAAARAGSSNRSGTSSKGGVSARAGAPGGAGATSRAGAWQGGTTGVAGSPEEPGGAGGAPPDCPPSTQRVGDDCEPIKVTQLALGALHSCVLLSDASVRCWGYNANGELGYGDTQNRVVEPRELPPLEITTEPHLRVTQLAAGGDHTCALLSDGSVKCWGRNVLGQLGYGHEQSIGDDELPSSLGAVQVSARPGLKAVSLAAGSSNTCALLSNGTVKCWGANGSGQLGQGNTQPLGDDELPASAPDVVPSATPGLRATSITVGYAHVCVRLRNGAVQCWGSNSLGQIGLGQLSNIGDDELPASVAPVSITKEVGVVAESVMAGDLHTCALLSNGTSHCWGHNDFGQLGYGNKQRIGDDELPSSVGPAGTWPGEPVQQIASSAYHACVLLLSGKLQCWGVNGAGQLGYGTRAAYIGDDEPLLPPYPVSALRGVVAQAVLTGGDRACAILSDGTIKCWGNNAYGQLGYGNTVPLGDDELPADIGTLRFF